MAAKKIISIVLVLASLALGYLGITKVMESEASVDVVGIEINASDKDQKRNGYIMCGAAVLLLIGGVFSFNKK